MDVLIYTGNHFERFSISGWNEHGGDGACNQNLALAATFAAKGHNVTVSGDVTTEKQDGITFTNTDDLTAGSHYDLVIAVSYIHYINELDSREITWDKSIFLLHQQNHFAWWQGEELENKGERNFRDPRMTWIVTLSDKHARAFTKANPYSTRKMRVIGNAINPAEWDEGKVKKKPGKFICCTKDKDMLAALLSIWPAIRTGIPKAELVVATPYTGDENEVFDHPELPGVSYLGSLPHEKLRAEIRSAEYWLNPSLHEEEYGVTALEMMMGGVKIVSTGFGNLGALLEGRGAVVDLQDEEVAEATLRTFIAYAAESKLAEGNAKRAKAFAAQQNWDTRYDAWIALANDDPKTTVKHPELFTYFEDKEAWERRFMTYAARTKEWELVAEEPFDNCFSVPLFTPEFCRMIREEAEHAESWTTDRHAFFPTTDLVLQVLDLEDTYRAIVNEYIVPCAKKLWVLGREWDGVEAETFLAKYTAEAQGHLSLHHDDSEITCLIQLSDLDEYEGGGTYFSRQKKLVKNGIGHATLHPGHITHRHGARSISAGKRYILVSFITRTGRR